MVFTQEIKQVFDHVWLQKISFIKVRSKGDPFFGACKKTFYAAFSAVIMSSVSRGQTVDIER